MLTYLINLSITWITLFAIYKLFLEREKYFVLNRTYLLVSLILGLALPLISYIPIEQQSIIPTINSEWNHAYQSQMAAVADFSERIDVPKKTKGSNYRLSWLLVFQLIYLLGLSVALIRVLGSFLKLVTLVRKSETVKKSTHTEILIKDDILPFSFMRFIFIGGQEYDYNERKNILNHELFHVQAYHSVDIILVEIVKIIFWWHPMIYFYKRSITENHEYAADEAVLAKSSRKQYCQLLMTTTFCGVNLELTNPFFQSFIKKRITMMYQTKSSKVNLLKYVMALVAVLMIATILVDPILAQSEGQIKTSSTLGLEKDENVGYVSLDKSIYKATQEGKELFAGNDYSVEPISGKLNISNEVRTNGNPIIVHYTDKKQQTTPVGSDIPKEIETKKNRPTTDCKKNKNNLFYSIDQPSRLPSCPEGEEGWTHAISTLSKFAKANFKWPQEAILEGQERFIHYQLAIDEEGNIAEVLPPSEYFKKRPLLYGLEEEGMRIVDLMREEFKFIPGKCNGKTVRTGTAFSLKLKIPEEKKYLVKIKDSSNTLPHQDITVGSISDKGSMGFRYRSNMNVGVSFKVTDPDGELVFTDSIDHIYSLYMTSIPLPKKINGIYKVSALQDGVEKVVDIHVTIFK